MNIRIITDSGSDITQAEAALWNIEVLPLKTIFGAEEFIDGITISHADFYRRLAEQPATTSQVTPAQYAAAFDSAHQTGAQILCITLSSLLSGCHQSAVIASEGLPVRIVDSGSVCVGQRILVERAVALRDQGLSADEIAAILENEKKRIRIYAALDTLEYLKRGGRISSAAALAGSLLNIKPLITVTDGTVSLVGKARGEKKAGQMLTDFISRHGIDPALPFCLAYSGPAAPQLQSYIAENEPLFGPQPPVSSIGSVIGTHTGPGVIGGAFFARSL